MEKFYMLFATAVAATTTADVKSFDYAKATFFDLVVQRTKCSAKVI